MISQSRHRSLLAVLAASVTICHASDGQQTQTVAGLTQYRFGTPSGDETEILALINRARANPPAEGQRLASGLAANYPGSGVGSVNELLMSFGSYPPRPPLAFHAKLNASAQAHTADMAATGIMQHNSSDGTPSTYRIESFGYACPRGENISDIGGPRKVSPWATESGYETDTYNVETGTIGHRLNIMEPTSIGSVEIGVACTANGNWNTEDFGADPTPTLLTGVVFSDNAGTGFYTSGEGVASVVVTAPGASSYYAVTVASGAYTLPLDLVPAYNATAAAPPVQVVFTDALGNVTTRSVTLTHTVGTDGYSTYCDAAGNVRYDNAEADLAQPGSTHPAFFAGETALGQGVYYLAFPNGNDFGYYAFLSDPHFVYHFDMGYEYVIDAGDSKGGVYLYDFESGSWFYTSPTFGFPYLYDFALNAFLYYYPDPNNPDRYNTSGVRWFYNFSTGRVVTL